MKKEKQNNSNQDEAYSSEVIQKLIKSKGKEFKKISNDAYTEWEQFTPCDKCKFLNIHCHKTCGVVMKWMHKEGLIKPTESYGKPRITSASEYDDTTGILDDEAIEAQNQESSDEITENEIDSILND